MPVEDILTLSQAPALPVTVGGKPRVERRRKPRDYESSRLRSRAIEFSAIAFVAGALSMAAVGMLQQAFARPMQTVAAALP